MANSRAGKAEIMLRLMDVIRERSVTQAELIRATGARSPTVSDWYNKGSLPDPDKLASLVRHLRINGHWLLTGQGPKSAPGEGSSETDRAYVVGARSVLNELKKKVLELEMEFSPSRANPSLDAAALAAGRVIARTAVRPQGKRKQAP